MNIIEQIKAEIERRITDNTFGAKLELIDILAWLDTLESEKPMKAESIENHIDELNGKYLGGVYSSYDMAKAYVEGQNNILTNLDKYNLMRRTKSPSSDLKETGKPMQDELEEEIQSFWNRASGFQPKFATLEVKENGFATIARHFAKWGAEHLKK